MSCESFSSSFDSPMKVAQRATMYSDAPFMKTQVGPFCVSFTVTMYLLAELKGMSASCLLAARTLSTVRIGSASCRMAVSMPAPTPP
jgi:hypothetical protein